MDAPLRPHVVPGYIPRPPDLSRSSRPDGDELVVTCTVMR